MTSATSFCTHHNCWGSISHPRSTHYTRGRAEQRTTSSLHETHHWLLKLSLFTVISVKFHNHTPRVLIPVDSRSSFPAEPASGNFHCTTGCMPESSHSKVAHANFAVLQFDREVTSCPESTKVRRDILPDLTPALLSPAPLPGQYYTGVQ